MSQDMYAVRFTDQVRHHRALLSLTPHTGYVTTKALLDQIQLRERQHGRHFIEEFRFLGGWKQQFPHWDGTDLTGKNVAYFAYGRYGDILIQTAAMRQLRLNYERMRLTVYARSPFDELLNSSPDIYGLPRPVGIVIPEAEVQQYDCWIVPEQLTLLERGKPDNCYALLERDLGIRIRQKTPHYYIPGPLRASNRELIAELSDRSRIRGYVVIQLNSSEFARTPECWYEVIPRLLQELNGKSTHTPWLVVLLGDETIDTQMLGEELGDNPYLLWLLRAEGRMSLGPEGVMAMVESASLVICPDSFLLHAAAAFDVPTLALWNDAGDPTGLQPIPPPESRLATYPWAHALSMHASTDTIIEAATHRIRHQFSLSHA